MEIRAHPAERARRPGGVSACCCCVLWSVVGLLLWLVPILVLS